MNFVMRSVLNAGLAATALFAGAPPALAQSAGLPALIKAMQLGPEEVGYDWGELDRIRGTKWGQGPVILSKPAPDGSQMARPGQATIEGRGVQLAASGARAGVFTIYIRDAVTPREIDAIAQDFRTQGFAVTKARCLLSAATGPETRGWLKLSRPAHHPIYLFANALASGMQGYTVYFDDLPPMTQAEAQRYTDNCRTGPGGATVATPGAARPVTGQAVAVEAIQAFLRPPGAPTVIPWNALPTATGLVWKKPPAMKMASPYSDGGADPNPRLLEGNVKSATTEMLAMATGTDQGANHFSLMNAQHMPRGAVFAGLQQAGYSLTALRCGKTYTQMSDAWFRISGPGRQPAVLYRVQYGGDNPTEAYIVRLDNLLPPMLAGQSNPVGGRCPG